MTEQTHGRQTAGDIGAQGELTPDGARTFTFDPRDPVPTAGGAIASFIEAVPLSTGAFPPTPPFGQRLTAMGPFFRMMTVWGPADQSEAEWQIMSKPPFRRLRDRPDVLCFETVPLEAGIEVTGPVEAVLWVSSSAADTGFTVKLVDVYPTNADFPDGYDMLLCDTVLRCRYRDSWTTPEPMRPGQSYRLQVTLPPTSNFFAAGHRLRVDISSSNFPRFDVNPNTGEPVGRHTRVEKAQNTVWMDAERPSHVVVPVAPESRSRGASVL